MYKEYIKQKYLLYFIIIVFYIIPHKDIQRAPKELLS